MFHVEVSSSPVDVPQIKYGVHAGKASTDAAWSWLDVDSPVPKCAEKVIHLLGNFNMFHTF